MAMKSAAVAPPPPDTSPIELEAAANRGRAMKEIMNDLDKGGQLTKFLNEYSRKIEHYVGGTKAGGSRAAKKK